MKRVTLLVIAIAVTCAPSVSAATKANTRLTIDAVFLGAGETQWSGDIFSPRKSCKDHRLVVVFRVRPGADQRMGATRAKQGISSPGYFWTLSKPGAAPDSLYYARVKPTAACEGDRSKNLRMGEFANRT